MTFIGPPHLGYGIWADGSCFSKVIPTLQAEEHEVMAAQYGLDTLAGDVAAVKRTLGRVSSPAILVGHSYGGAVITAAGTDDRVAGLVSYILATSDRTVHPELQRFLAKRMGATTYEVASSHVPMLSNPNLVIDVIRTAANAVRGRSTTAGR
jgi:alpha-beta hydrolase superfamily lysophospholipase